MLHAVFAREALTSALWTEAMPLLRAHWREIAHYQDIPLDPDQALYATSAAAGVLRFFSVRQPWSLLGEPFVVRAAPLVGYAVFFVRPSPHYRQSVQAAQDVLYLAPSARGITGVRFVAWCDEQLRAEGVQAVYHHQKLAHPQLGRVLAKLGYQEVDRIWARRLDYGHHDLNSALCGERGSRQSAAPEGEGRVGGPPPRSRDTDLAPIGG